LRATAPGEEWDPRRKSVVNLQFRRRQTIDYTIRMVIDVRRETIHRYAQHYFCTEKLGLKFRLSDDEQSRLHL